MRVITLNENPNALNELGSISLHRSVTKGESKNQNVCYFSLQYY